MLGGGAYNKTRESTPMTNVTAQLAPMQMLALAEKTSPVNTAQNRTSSVFSSMLALRLAHLRKRPLRSVRSW